MGGGLKRECWIGIGLGREDSDRLYRDGFNRLVLFVRTHVLLVAEFALTQGTITVYVRETA